MNLVSVFAFRNRAWITTCGCREKEMPGEFLLFLLIVIRGLKLSGRCCCVSVTAAFAKPRTAVPGNTCCTNE